MDSFTTVSVPHNEPVRDYAPGRTERAGITEEIARLRSAGPVELTMAIGDERRSGAGSPVPVRAPHDHQHLLGALSPRSSR
jgi:1-pyrroline-5-carboxylate dehydrogenase